MSRATLKVLLVAVFCLVLLLRLNPVVSPTLSLTIILFAVWRGDWEERALALALAANLIWTRLNHPYELSSPRIAVLFGDLLFLLAKTYVALHSEKWWPSWAAAFGVLIVLSHVLFMTWPNAVEPWAYWSSVVIWSWLGLIALGLGVLDAVGGDGRRLVPMAHRRA